MRVSSRRTGALTVLAKLAELDPRLQKVASLTVVNALLRFLTLDEKTQKQMLLNAALLKGVFDKEAALANIFNIEDDTLVLMAADFARRFEVRLKTQQSA